MLLPYFGVRRRKRLLGKGRTRGRGIGILRGISPGMPVRRQGGGGHTSYYGAR